MNLRNCDACGKRFKELNRVEVGKHKQEWHVCPSCYTNVIPRISKETEVPLLSLLFPFGKLSFRIEVEGDPVEAVKSVVQRIKPKESLS